jgi:hypothetical protein
MLSGGPQRLVDPTRQPLYFAGRNRFAPDLLRCPIPSQTRPLPLLRLIPPPARFWPNRDASLRPRLPHAAPSHPLTVDHLLRTEPTHRVVVHSCRMPQHTAAALAAIPWPTACRQGTRTALPDGSCAHASPRPPPSPPVLCSSATHARLHALFTVWCMPSHGVVPQHSLPLQRGTDSHLVPKCAALHHVMAVVAVLESPRSRAREHACSATAPSRHLPLSLLT